MPQDHAAEAPTPETPTPETLTPETPPADPPPADPGDIARLRRFNRAATSAAGVLDASFLGRGRPLGESRMLHALGPDGDEVGAARARLGLDSGLASRLLRSLEAEGLIETVRHPEDGRRRIARPTARGRAEFAAYERLSDAHASATIARFGRAAPDLLAAMDRLACALGADRIALRVADPESPEAQACMAAYYAELDRRFASGFDVDSSGDPEAASMRAPRGAFLLAEFDGAAIGCAGLAGPETAPSAGGEGERKAGRTGEVKRVWIAPQARGLGLSRRLMSATEDVARGLGMTRLRLDTNGALTEAAALYRRMGWREIERYNDNPYAELFFDKPL
ncbi:MAG: PadR family transcriptional regulator [Rhodobacteraceae bacterium]|nr:PadR family transcriptional regulator [Paracoccaceae bacterium]MBR26927.1 PadR family transcriptional regulator [Paracoccaceae bacterium]